MATNSSFLSRIQHDTPWSSYYIEKTLLSVCDGNDSSDHSLLEGGYYIQPGFTLLVTIGILIAYVVGRRLERFVEICWPRHLESRAERLIVSSSTLSYSDQRGLVSRLNEAIPSIRGVFANWSFITAAKRIAERDLRSKRTTMRFLCCCWKKEGIEQSDDDEEVGGKERSAELLMANHSLGDACHDDTTHRRIRRLLATKLQSEDAASIIASKFRQHEWKALELHLGSEVADGQAHADEDLNNARAHQTATAVFALNDGHGWEVWRDSAGEDELAQFVEEVELWMESRNEIADRDFALIFLFLEVLVAIWALVEYFSLAVMEGQHWYLSSFKLQLGRPMTQPSANPSARPTNSTPPRFYCKIPYWLAVVSYKPFAIPMWACITIACPYTFAEQTFGNHPRGRDASGTPLSSSVPRNVFSVGLILVVTLLLYAWVAIALFAYGLLLVVFSPVLVIPAFFIPFLAVALPTKSLDCAVSRADRRIKGKEKTRRLKPGDRVEISTGTEPWRSARVLDIGRDDRPVVVPDYPASGEEGGAVWDKYRLATPSEFVLYGKFEETIFALRLAATQLIIAVTVSLPLIQFYTGKYSWSTGALEVLGVSFNVPSLVRQLQVSFAWPVYYVPKLQVQLVMGVSLVAIQCLLRGGQFVIRFTRHHPFLMLRFSPGGSVTEQVLSRMFALVSWLPFRMAMDRMRSAMEGAHLVAKRNKEKDCDDKQDEAASPKGLMNRAQTFFFCIAIFLFWLPFQGINDLYSRKDLNVKSFPSKARDDDLAKFCDSEAALWYSGIAVDSNPNIAQILPWAYQLIWLRILRITNCPSVEGNIEEVCGWLVDLTHLEVGDQAPLSPLAGIRGRGGLFKAESSSDETLDYDDRLDEIGEDHPRRLHWIQGDIACLGKLRMLTWLNLSMTKVAGNIAVLGTLQCLRAVNLSGCTSVRGSISVFRGTQRLEVLQLRSTSINGDIQVFQRTRKLRVLDLGFTRARGSLSLVHCLPELSVLDLQRTMCHGTIEVFEHHTTPFLKTCMLSGLHDVEGSLCVFRHTPLLEHLGLSETSCHGDVSVFQFTPELRLLHLAHATAIIDRRGSVALSRGATTTVIRRDQVLKVQGSIGVFEWTKNLRSVSLHATLCHGDISVFQFTPHILDLNLNGTQISGSIAVFHCTSVLRSINLWKTQARGDIVVFAGLQTLRSLICAHAQVHGDKDALRIAVPGCETFIVNLGRERVV